MEILGIFDIWILLRTISPRAKQRYSKSASVFLLLRPGSTESTFRRCRSLVNMLWGRFHEEFPFWPLIRRQYLTLNFYQGPRGEAKRRGPKPCVDIGCCRIFWPSMYLTDLLRHSDHSAELPLLCFSNSLGYLVATEHWDHDRLKILANNGMN